MPELHELPGEGSADNAGSEYSKTHARYVLRLRTDHREQRR